MFQYENKDGIRNAQDSWTISYHRVLDSFSVIEVKEVVTITDKSAVEG